MNKILALCSLVVLLGLASCTEDSPKSKHHKKAAVNGKKPSPNVSVNRKQQFEKFIRKFKPMALPLTIKTLEIEPGAAELKITDKDSLFIRTRFPNETRALGMLSDTSTTIQLLWLEPAEMYNPVLTTFTKSGQKISEQHLSVGSCGADCCFTCDEYIYIRKDRSIYGVDSIKSCVCDAKGPNQRTMKRYIRYITGQIAADGKISLSKVREKNISPRSAPSGAR